MHTGRLHLHSAAVPLFLMTNRPNTNCGHGISIVIQEWHNCKWTDRAGRQACLATFTRQQLVEVALQDEDKRRKML